MYGEQGVKAVHKNAYLVKIWGKGYSLILVQRLLVKCITLLQDIHEKYCMVLVPGCTIRHKKLIQFSLCLWWCALQLRNSATGLYCTCEKHIYKFDFLSSNLCFGVLHSQKCHVMSQCYLNYTCRQSYGSDFSSLF